MKIEESSFQNKLDLGCYLNHLKLRTKIKSLIFITEILKNAQEITWEHKPMPF